MTMNLQFLGAARNVTGSAYLLDTGQKRILVDCGLYQERKFRHRNWASFPVPPDSLDAILLTHAHIDHCGLLPKIVREGFRGPIYCTLATSEITRIMLLDAARLQEEDAEYKRRRHQKEGRKGPYPELPLYNTRDTHKTFPLFAPVDYDRPVHIGDNIEASFHEAGHVLGSAMIKVAWRENGKQRVIIFSGDVGRWNKPILKDPTLFNEADYVVVESTYGDRLHGYDSGIAGELSETINKTMIRGGNIVVPSFALERSQELLYYLNRLQIDGLIPHLMIFVDSPMAIKVTRVFRNHPELFDKEMADLVRRKKSPFTFTGLKMVSSVEESKAINRINGTVIVIAGSGMCTGGRVKHHLISNIARKESTVLFVGYQAIGTLGRQIVDGASRVRILGKRYPVRATVTQINGFSAHADRNELYRWLSGLSNKPRHVFVTHGESEAAKCFAGFIVENTGWKVSVPVYRDKVYMD
jgi:metallo-beta-lactamase family protein